MSFFIAIIKCHKCTSLLVLLIKHAYHKLGNMNKLSSKIKLGGLDGHAQF